MKLTKSQLIKIIKEELKNLVEAEEAYGGALGSFPERYGDAHKISPRRGHPMYKADDELREIGSNIGNILELTERTITDLKTMQVRYGEMAHMGAYAKMADNEAQKLSEKYRDALDALSRSKQLGEKTLTKPEKKEKERLVKGMKKDAGGFEERYPGRGEQVMYATATKQAKKRK